MSTSISFKTPSASFSTIDMAINNDQDDDVNRLILSNQTSLNSFMTTMPKRNRGSDIHLQTITRDNRLIQSIDENRNDEDDQPLTSHYHDKRLKQEKLLFITNIFRLVIIIILAPIIYFLV